MPHGIRFVWVALWLSTVPAAAQTYSAGADVLLYADNTEFANPFRTGETTLGASGRIFIDAALNDTVTLRGGLFGLGRFGSHRALEHAEPVLALQMSRGDSRFIFGSLDTAAFRHDTRGPDLETPHGLLPPIQQDTLTFTRGQEMGLQWLVQHARVEQDAWINWQRLNTERHRERFDAGYRADIGVTAAWRVHGQWHVVHEGGQQFASGAVRDSQAGALGLSWRAPAAGTDMRATVEAHLVASQEVRDRERPDTSESGAGVFTRAALERGAWRTHLIVWRGRHLLKDEGDANYLARRRDGTFFGKVRDYGEVGLTRHFRPAPGVHMFAAFRIHRVESAFEYSYRIVARVRVRHSP
jgi:hypothetical protein